jgi:HD-like signal output (HDOD) protein
MATLLEPEASRSVERRIEQVYELPPMPELGRRILALQSDPNAGARELANIVQLDPSLAAQVIRYASSSYYGYTGRITNIQEAISRVLGYDMVMNLAIGLAAGRSFCIPEKGPLGLNNFWEHAIMSAVLMQRLSAVMPEGIRPPQAQSYLCGLLHDFGILLLGHLFPPEFHLLNKLAQANPTQSVADLESRLLGMGEAREMIAMGHARIGAWLMEAWRMPDPLRVALLEHHNADYRGEYELLVHLVQLSDFLLQHMDDSQDSSALPENSLRLLQLVPEQVEEIVLQVVDARPELVTLSRQLAGNCGV